MQEADVGANARGILAEQQDIMGTQESKAEEAATAGEARKFTHGSVTQRMDHVC